MFYWVAAIAMIFVFTCSGLYVFTRSRCYK